MKLDAGEIKDLVAETKRKRADWAKAAEEWEKMWSLQRYDDNRTDRRELDGLDQITTPDPFNIVQLLTRFVASDMRLEIPYISAKDEDDERSTLLEEFLMAFDQRSSRQQGRNLTDDKVWYSAVRGRGASQTIWIADVLPKGLKDKRLPILKRNLDPLNVGVGRGPYWTDYAYHEYRTTRNDIMQRYPKHKLPDPNNTTRGYWKEEYEVIDIYTRHEGAVWHAVTVKGEFAKPPTKTDYPEIPIVEWMADGAPIEEELARSLSILHPIREMWRAKCDFVSKIGTGLLYYFDPLMIATNMDPGQKIDTGPGAVAYLNPGQTLDALRPEPNVPMAEKMLALLQTSMDQATFSSVAYGEAAGGVTAGFAINNLAQAAQSRANTIRNNIEGAMEAENELVLMEIEAFSPDEGVEVWGGSSSNDRKGPIHVSAKDIKGNYANEVRLIPEKPTDDNGRVMTWLQMVEKQIISKGTMRNRGVNVSLPRDEETRIAMENAAQMPEMAQKNMLRAIQKTYKQDDWELLISGTPLQQVYEAEEQWKEQKRAEEEAARQVKRDEKARQEQERLAAEMAGGEMHMMPDGTMMPGPPMDSMPPGIMSSGMPPNPGIPPGMPPGMMPPGMPPGPPPTGGGMEMGMQSPGLPGIPPQAAGQMTPDMLGIPPGAPPGQFGEMMGQPPMSDEELLQQLTGGGQPPMV